MIVALPRPFRLLLIASYATSANGLSLALYNGGSSFFEPVLEGFLNQCNVLGITCYHTTSPTGQTGQECAEGRRKQMLEWANMGVSGIAVKPCSDLWPMRAAFKEVSDMGVHITTFDRDLENSTRAAYIGTDNEFMGRTMAKLLRQLRPEGGTYVFVGIKIPRDVGFTKEITRYNHRDDRAHWHELEGPTEDYLWASYLQEGAHRTKSPTGNDYMPMMERAAELNPTAMIFLKQTPMRHANYSQFVDKHRHRGITYIGTDGSDEQLAYLNSRYVDGLVGQLPFQFGGLSAQKLYDLATKGIENVEVGFIPTNMVAYNLIPLELPSLDVDENQIGKLKFVGYICFGIVVISVIACLAWTWKHRGVLVVRAAQPIVLIMVAAGVLIMAGSLIPLTFDDGGDMSNPLSHSKSVGICMSIPWLAFIGFTTIFSALFSKLWRVNKLFRAWVTQARVTVNVLDVLVPFAVLLTLNATVLICWTVIDPLKYERIEHEGTDYWNRVISTYGSCQSENVLAYLVPLSVINICVVAIACWQAIQARDIKSEFSESKYIGLAMAALFQAFLTGIPVVVVVRDQPQAYYLVLTMIIFILSEVLLLLIFLPKFFLQRRYAKMTDEQQKTWFEQRMQEAYGDRVPKNSLVGVRGSGIDGSSAAVSHRPEESMSRIVFSGNSNLTVSERLASVEEVEETEDGPLVSMVEPSKENMESAVDSTFEDVPLSSSGETPSNETMTSTTDSQSSHPKSAMSETEPSSQSADSRAGKSDPEESEDEIEVAAMPSGALNESLRDE